MQGLQFEKMGIKYLQRVVFDNLQHNIHYFLFKKIMRENGFFVNRFYQKTKTNPWRTVLLPSLSSQEG